MDRDLVPEKNIQIQKVKAGQISTLLLIIGFRNYRESYIKAGQYNKETNFHNMTDPKAWYKI